MEAVSDRVKANIVGSVNDNPIVDTTFVLFFLAVDLGQNINRWTFDVAFMSIVLVAVMVLPYFLMSDKTDFTKWLFGRISIAVFAILLGGMFKQSLGVLFPETFSFLPLTLLIVTAMLSCYIQFYSFFRLRISK